MCSIYRHYTLRIGCRRVALCLFRLASGYGSGPRSLLSPRPACLVAVATGRGGYGHAWLLVGEAHALLNHLPREDVDARAEVLQILVLRDNHGLLVGYRRAEL